MLQIIPYSHSTFSSALYFNTQFPSEHSNILICTKFSRSLDPKSGKSTHFNPLSFASASPFRLRSLEEPPPRSSPELGLQKN